MLCTSLKSLPRTRAVHTCLRSFSAAAAGSQSSAAAAAPAFEPTVIFPPSKAYLARIAREQAKANPPVRAPKVETHQPRHFAHRTSTPMQVAEPPQRLDGAVPWKIQRRVDGLLPVELRRRRMETSKHFIRVHEISGDIKSLVSEVELFVGPMYTVKTNAVNTVLEIHSTPNTKVSNAFLDKFKQWLVKIGV